MIKKIESKFIKNLRKDLLNEKSNAIEDFWGYVEEVGTPLVESISDKDENMIVTVLYRQEVGIDKISVNGEVFGFSIEDSELYRIPNTDVWYRTYEIPKDVRSLYFFVINGNDEDEWCDMDLRIDPLNHKKFICPRDDEFPENLTFLSEVCSLLEMPDAADKKLIEPRTDGKSGKLELKRFKSEILKNERRIWVYTPFGYSSDAENYKLAIFFDGWDYINIIKAPNILDNLIADKLIPPTCAIFIDNTENRDKELGCYTPFIDFIAKEILPWGQENYNVTNNPNETIIGGFSFGGLAACYAGLTYPNKFNKILGQSGYFSWAPEGEKEEWIVREFNESEHLPLNLYLNVGTFELQWPFVVNSMNNFINVLKSKGYNFKNSIYTGGHVHIDWQDTFGAGLIWLLQNDN